MVWVARSVSCILKMYPWLTSRRSSDLQTFCKHFHSSFVWDSFKVHVICVSFSHNLSNKWCQWMFHIYFLRNYNGSTGAYPVIHFQNDFDMNFADVFLRNPWCKWLSRLMFLPWNDADDRKKCWKYCSIIAD